MSYAVVEFIEESSVEVVSQEWIEIFEKDFYCYWPRSNVQSKAKKMEKPDKQNWKKYPIRVFAYADTWDRALCLAKRACATSNLDTDLETNSGSPNTRACGKPSMEEFPDYSETENYESDESMKRSKKRARSNKSGKERSCPVLTPLLPAAPTFSSSLKRNDMLPGGALVSAVNSILSSNPRELYDELSDIPDEEQCSRQRTNALGSSKRSRVDGHISCQPSPRSIMNCGSSKRSRSDDQINRPRRATEITNRFSQDPVQPSTLATDSSTPNRPSQANGFQRSVLTKLDTIIEKHDEALSILRAILTASKGTIEEEAVLEDILPNPINTVEDVEDFSCRLDDESFRKKTLQFLIALCGHNCALSTRRIMARIGTNKLWSNYSLKGRKAKRPFKDLAICKIIIKACVKVHKGCNEINVEEQIAEFLKYAPNKSGGSRFKERQKDAHE